MNTIKDIDSMTIREIADFVLSGNCRYTSLSKAMNRLYEANFHFSKEELLKIAAYHTSPWDYKHNTLAHDISIDSHYNFSFEEIMIMGNPKNGLGESLGHIAARTMSFSTDQILKMRDSKDKFGETISLIIAKNGTPFSFSDIYKLHNPKDAYGTTLAHLSFAETRFSINELVRLGNPPDKDGDTIAHLMAKNGFIFTVDELLRLGNPLNRCGKSIAYIMAQKGYSFTEKEMSKLGLQNQPENLETDIEIKNLFMTDAVWYWDFHCDIYVNGVITARWDNCVSEDIKIINNGQYSILKDFYGYKYLNISKIIFDKFVEKSKTMEVPDMTWTQFLPGR